MSNAERPRRAASQPAVALMEKLTEFTALSVMTPELGS